LLLKKESQDENYAPLHFAGIDFHAKKYRSVLRVLFVVLLYCTGIFELMHQLRERMGEKIAFFILVEAYHLLFIIALNFGLARYSNRHIKLTVLTLNILSVLVFILGFVFLPISDFRENIIKTEMNYTGFLFHYLCLAAAVFISMRIFRMMRNKEVEMTPKPELTTAAITVSLVYIFSVELILHVAQLSMSNVTDEIPATTIEKLNAFNTLCLHIVKIGFPILWGVLAFAFLSIGMRKHNKTFRISGLVLIGIILLKLFTYDIKDASEAGKIIAFIILGVVLLIISFMYQKIKALLIDDSKKKEEADQNSSNTHPE